MNAACRGLGVLRLEEDGGDGLVTEVVADVAVVHAPQPFDVEHLERTDLEPPNVTHEIQGRQVGEVLPQHVVGLGAERGSRVQQYLLLDDEDEFVDQEVAARLCHGQLRVGAAVASGERGDSIADDLVADGSDLMLLGPSVDDRLVPSVHLGTVECDDLVEESHFIPPDAKLLPVWTITL